MLLHFSGNVFIDSYLITLDQTEVLLRNLFLIGATQITEVSLLKSLTDTDLGFAVIMKQDPSRNIDFLLKL